MAKWARRAKQMIGFLLWQSTRGGPRFCFSFLQQRKLNIWNISPHNALTMMTSCILSCLHQLPCWLAWQKSLLDLLEQLRCNPPVFYPCLLKIYPFGWNGLESSLCDPVILGLMSGSVHRKKCKFMHSRKNPSLKISFFEVREFDVVCVCLYFTTWMNQRFLTLQRKKEHHNNMSWKHLMIFFLSFCIFSRRTRPPPQDREVPGAECWCHASSSSWSLTNSFLPPPPWTCLIKLSSPHAVDQARLSLLRAHSCQ